MSLVWLLFLEEKSILAGEVWQYRPIVGSWEISSSNTCQSREKELGWKQDYKFQPPVTCFFQLYISKTSPDSATNWGMIAQISSQDYGDIPHSNHNTLYLDYPIVNILLYWCIAFYFWTIWEYTFAFPKCYNVCFIKPLPTDGQSMYLHYNWKIENFRYEHQGRLSGLS